MIDDRDVWPILVDLRDAVQVEVARSGVAPVSRWVIVPGSQLAMDPVCDSIGWVRPTTVFPSLRFPVTDTSATNCQAPLAFGVEVGIARCGANPTTMRGKVVLPSAEDVTQVAREVLADMALIRRAILGLRVESKMLGTYTPYGPDGALVGGMWSAFLSKD